MAYIQCKSGGAETPTLLWENSSPTSAFASQNITVDTDTYKAFIVIFELGTSYRAETYQSKNYLDIYDDAPYTNSNAKNHCMYCVIPNDWNNWTAYRRLSLSVSNKNIWFSNAWGYFGSSTSQTNNAYFVPLKIYGFKKPIIKDLKQV